VPAQHLAGRGADRAGVALRTEYVLKRIIIAAAAAAVAGLTACSQGAAPAATSHGSVRVPVSCSQQYSTWTHGQGEGLIAALHAISSAETAGDARVLTATLKQTKPTVSRAVRHPVPACADPRGYWDILLMHVTAAEVPAASASSVRAAMKNVPEIERRLTAELRQTAR
jgi:hypothetical protein